MSSIPAGFRGAAARRLCLGLCLGAFLAPAGVSAQARGAAPARSEARALLVRGSASVKGLPNFGRNALPALYGEYRLIGRDDAEGPRVWMTSEALYLSTEDWAPERLAGRASYAARKPASPESPGARLFLFDRPFASEGQGAAPRVWTVLMELPAYGDSEAAAVYERFVPVFLDRLSYFLANARSQTDVSFPAVLEW